MADAAATIFVVDDDASVRKGLEWLLRSAGFRVETFSSAAAYLERERYDGVGCVVLDVRMPGLDGIALQQTLVGQGHDIPIVFLTAYAEVPTTVRAMKSGAVDFLIKPVDEQVLLSAIEEALSRHHTVYHERRAAEHVHDRIATLTPRELDVMRCMLSGRASKRIAAHLGIAEKTVRIHRGRVMRKMAVSSIAELVRVCATAGIEAADIS